jgi:hypothetical protein
MAYRFGGIAGGMTDIAGDVACGMTYFLSGGFEVCTGSQQGEQQRKANRQSCYHNVLREIRAELELHSRIALVARQLNVSMPAGR